MSCPSSENSTPIERSSLDDWLNYLMSIHAKSIDMGLSRVVLVAQKLNLINEKPETRRLVIAGTNGKGSTQAILTAIMQAAGYRIGCYSSPHLFCFNERAQINHQSLSDDQWIKAFMAIEHARDGVTLSFFEFTTLAALWYFHQQSLDLIILEVGLGGRLDAVNAVNSSSAIITAIDLDHQEWLGDNREDIGFEKAGVMRAGALCICSDSNVPKTLKNYAASLNVDLRCLGLDFEFDNDGLSWCYRGNETFEHLPSPKLKGEFQLQNASGVLAWLDWQKDFKVTQSAIEQGLKNVSHKGRLDLRYFNDQAWLFDVAHNPHAVKQLAHWLEQENQVYQNKPVAIFAAFADKDVKTMIELMKDHVAQWVFLDLRPESRALDPNIMFKFVNEIQEADDPIEAYLAKTSQQALEFAIETKLKRVVIFGSFITVGTMLKELERHG